MKKKCLEGPESSGTLFVAALPIGNLKDITPRVLETAEQVDYILAEDTRTVTNLFSRFNIKQKYVSYHDYSEQAKRDKVLDDLS